MKQKIYDIPIWDAFELENCECPLCAIEKKTEEDFINTIFTDMIMDVRLNPQLVKEYRFCREHFEKLYRYPDKFGLAILTDRILYLEKDALKKFKSRKLSGVKAGKSFLDYFSGKSDKKAEKSAEEELPCLLCTKIDNDMERFLDTLIKLWVKEVKFRELYAKSRGFCLKHFKDVIHAGETHISSSDLSQQFTETTFKLQETNLDRLHEELQWFITKFDYRFADEPWKTSKDSLIRTILKITGNYNNKN
jgi:hypothetical protein